MQHDRVSNDAILSAIQSSLENAARTFELVANVPSDPMDWAAARMPEAWVVVQLMHGLHNLGLGAFPEVRIPKDLDEEGEGILSGARKMTGDRYESLRRKRIDLFAFDRSGHDNALVLRVAMEVKAGKSKEDFSDFAEDIERLEALADGRGDDQLFVLAYATFPLTVDELKKEKASIRAVLDRAKEKDWDLRVSPAANEGMHWEEGRNPYAFLICR